MLLPVLVFPVYLNLFGSVWIVSNYPLVCFKPILTVCCSVHFRSGVLFWILIYVHQVWVGVPLVWFGLGWIPLKQRTSTQPLCEVSQCFSDSRSETKRWNHLQTHVFLIIYGIMMAYLMHYYYMMRYVLSAFLISIDCMFSPLACVCIFKWHSKDILKVSCSIW